MSTALLEFAAATLGPVVDEVAFVGGASLGVWMTDPGAPDLRITLDVDVIVVVDTRPAYYELGERLRRQGFNEDATSPVICRWRHGNGLILDVMPTEASILGFTNRWYADAIATAVRLALPSGTRIRAVRPDYLVATEIEAYLGRGDDDLLSSIDFEDLVRLIDGREELCAEIAMAPEDVRAFIATSLQAMSRRPLFPTAVAGALLPDMASQQRLPLVLRRISEIAGA